MLAVQYVQDEKQDSWRCNVLRLVPHTFVYCSFWVSFSFCFLFLLFFCLVFRCFLFVSDALTILLMLLLLPFLLSFLFLSDSEFASVFFYSLRFVLGFSAYVLYIFLWQHCEELYFLLLFLLLLPILSLIHI